MYRFEEIISIILIALTIFIIGVQVGIRHGQELQEQKMQEVYEYKFAN